MNNWHNAFHQLPRVAQYLAIALLASLLFFPLLGGVHLFDWDEINFAECAREMIVTKDYIRCQIDFMPFWEKPPVFIWMQALAMQLFGIGEYAARFPNACIGVVTLLTLYYAGIKVKNEKFALWWVIAYAASWLPQFYFKTGIIDPTFNYFIFLGFFQLHLLKWKQQKITHAVLAGLFLGIAVLTKGPVAILVVGISAVVYGIVNRGFAGYKVGHVIVIGICALLPFVAWMTVAGIQHGAAYTSWFVTEFVSYQIRLLTTEDADHGGPFYYHFVILLLGCFPASLFFLERKRMRDEMPGEFKDMKLLMRIMFWVVLILFSIVKTKIVHYSSLCYYPLTFLAANSIAQLADGRPMKKRTISLLRAIGILIAVLITLVPVVGLNKGLIIPLIDDPFAVGNLQASVPWSYAECLYGLTYLVLILLATKLMQKQFIFGIGILIVAQLLIVQVVIMCFTPKIEAYSQRAAIEYYKSFKGTDAYIAALGYKSYAYLFYAEKQPFAAPSYYATGKVNEHWLMYGEVDHPTYFITKVQNARQYYQLPQLEKTGEKNGFVYFRRNK